MSSVDIALSPGEEITSRRRAWTSSATGRDLDVVYVTVGSVVLSGNTADMTRLRDQLTAAIGDQPGAAAQPATAVAV